MARRLGKILALVVAGAISVLLVLYLSLLGLEAYSARQAATVLSGLEALRIGDPVADFDTAVSPMRDEYGVYALISGPFRFKLVQQVMGSIDEHPAIREFVQKAGLRYWRLTADDQTQDGKLSAISVTLMVEGRYEMLGTDWTLAPDIPGRYKQPSLSGEDLRTNMGWMHITSDLSGEAFRINATGESSEKELRARTINSKCLLSFRGCDGLCELLPDAVPVLRERKRGWGGYTGVPQSHCDGP